MRQHHSAWQVYADVLMCVLAFMMLLTSLLLIVTHINATTKQEGIKPKAEYLVTLTWDDARNVDLDLWLKDPQGNVIYYRSREDTNISLDRDSRGFITNRTTLSDGTIVDSGNREIDTIRAVIPGDYLVAVGYYENMQYSDDPAIDCLVEVTKLNPTLTLVASAKLHFTKVKEAQNAVAFHVNADGSVQMLPLPPENLIEKHTTVGIVGSDG